MVELPIPARVNATHEFSDFFWRENVREVVLIKYDAKFILDLNFVCNMILAKDEDLTIAFLCFI